MRCAREEQHVRPGAGRSGAAHAHASDHPQQGIVVRFV